METKKVGTPIKEFRAFVKHEKQHLTNAKAKEFYAKFFEEALSDKELLEKYGKAITVQEGYIAVISPRICKYTPSGLEITGDSLIQSLVVNNSILGHLVVNSTNPDLIGKRVILDKGQSQNAMGNRIDIIPLGGKFPGQAEYQLTIYRDYNVIGIINDFTNITGENYDEREFRL